MLADRPQISIVAATRDRALSLSRLLASLEMLQSPPVLFEVIIADNGSSDDTPRILHEWAQRAAGRKVLRVEKPGKSRALNAALRVAEGQLLAFVDDDVIVDATYLRELWNYFTSRLCGSARGHPVATRSGD